MGKGNFLKDRQLLVLSSAILILIMLILAIALSFNGENLFSVFKGRQGERENTTTSHGEAGRFMVQPLSPGFR
jgi:hypothetical protein